MKLKALFTRRPRRSASPARRPVQTTLEASTAAARRGDIDDYESGEPTTSLSMAFIIVFLLHVVAVVGIYLFNHIKSTRPASTVATSASAKAKQPPKEAAPVAKTAPTETRPAVETRREPVSVAKTMPSGARIHHVQSGENLTKIATKYEVTLEDLEEANKLDSKAVLQVGQILNIPATKSVTRQPVATTPKSEPAKTTTAALPLKPTTAPAVRAAASPQKAELRSYTVDEGDTITYIAKRYKVSVADLTKLNNITDPKKLQPGRKLKIPASH